MFLYAKNKFYFFSKVGVVPIGLLADQKCLAPVAAASPERSAGISRRTGTNINSCTGAALLKKSPIILKKAGDFGLLK